MNSPIFNTALNEIISHCLRDYGPSPRFLFYEISDVLLGRLQGNEFAGAEIVLLNEEECEQWRKNRKLPLAGEYDYIFLSDLTCRIEDIRCFVQDARLHLRGNGKLLGFFCAENIDQLQKMAALVKEDYEVLNIIDFEAAPQYLFKAEKYFLREHTSWLRSFSSPEIRRQLVWKLRRIENDVQTEENIQGVLALCKSQRITQEYLRYLIEDTLLQGQKVYQILHKRMDL